MTGDAKRAVLYVELGGPPENFAASRPFVLSATPQCITVERFGESARPVEERKLLKKTVQPCGRTWCDHVLSRLATFFRRNVKQG